MANFFSFIVLSILCVVLQSTLFAYWGVWGLRVELLIIVLTFVALYYALIPGCFLAVVMGYLYDLNSASPMGLHSLTFLSCFLLLNLTRNRLYIHGPAFCIGLVAFMVFFHDFLLTI